MSTINAGGFARLLPGSEIWRVLQVDGDYAWLGDDFGNRPVTHRIEDLQHVPYSEGRDYFARCRKIAAEINPETGRRVIRINNMADFDAALPEIAKAFGLVRAREEECA